ncbi:MAG: acyl-CoA dehydrogenase family protein [Acidimicrobiales bacterium]
MSASHDELVDRARQLAPAIAARATLTEAQRHPHDDTIAELIDAELLSILVPKRWGGHELSIHTHREVTEIISVACLSTGWNFAFYSGHNWMAVKYPERAQEELFADKGYALVPVTTAPTLTVEPVEGGMMISGRVSWGSGIVHADWACIGGATPDGTRYQFLVRAEDTTIIDTWHMAAMAGTGSHDFELRDVFVPEHRVLLGTEFRNGDTPGARLHANPQYRMPVLPFIYCETMGIFSGGIRGAVAAFEEIVRGRVRTHSGAALADNRYMHIKLGEAAAAAEVTQRLVTDLTQEAIDLADGDGFTLEERLRLKARAGFIVDLCRRAVNDMIHHAGSSNFATEAPLQRFFRDFNMLATHAFYEWDTGRELLGRHRLGLEPNHPLV